MEMIKEVAVQSERAVIVVTHDSRIFEFGDRIVEMSDGRVERIEEGGTQWPRVLKGEER